MNSPRRLPILLLALALTVLASACTGGKKGSGFRREPMGNDSASVKMAKTIYTTNCATCHGTGGRGDGAGAPVDPKPRSFRDESWQAEKSDEHIKTVILEGGQAVGLSNLMPPAPFTQLHEDPEMLNALVQYVRSFGEY